MTEFIKEGSVWKKVDETSTSEDVVEDTEESLVVEDEKNVVENNVMVGETVEVEEDEEIVEEEVLDETREFVRKSYREILGRDPYPDDLYGLNYYAKELEVGGGGGGDVSGSKERFTTALVVRKCYLDVLLRDPFPDDMGGLNNYVEEISSGRITRGGLLSILERSQEYQEKFNMGINSMGKVGGGAGGGSGRMAKTNPSRRNKVAIDMMFPGLGRKRENKKIKVSPSPTGSSEGIVVGGGVGGGSGGGMSGGSSGGQGLVYCMMGGNKLHEIKGYVEMVLPYVDGFVYVDSHSTDGTLEYMNELKSKEGSDGSKIVIIEKDWEDKFSAFRNHYLDYLRGIGYKGWVICSDTDEHFPIETLSQLRGLIQNAKSYTGASFRAYDVTLTDDNSGVVAEGLSNPGYYKHLMFRFYPDMKYIGEPHETLTGHKIVWAQTELIYRHARSKLKVYWRAMENFYISNSNRASQNLYSRKWAEFRQLCSQNNIFKFETLKKHFVDGTLSGNIEDWIMTHKNIDEDSGDSEIRETYKLYFEILHPEKVGSK